MNEHIKELYYKAHDTSDVEGSFPQYFSATKFADLIIKECLAQCNQHFAGAVGTHAGAYNTGVKKCVDSIKEHFGVEE